MTVFLPQNFCHLWYWNYGITSYWKLTVYAAAIKSSFVKFKPTSREFSNSYLILEKILL